jgi:phosphinothricin acetyltransferase
MIEIRDAVATDMVAILPIYNDAVINTTAVYDYTARTIEGQQKWYAAKLEQNLPVLVATDEGEVVGFSSYGPFRPWPAYLYTVENSIYVAPDQRGKGIGAALLGPLIERARKAGLHTMAAGIDASNEVSIKLHARFGFVQAGHFKEVGWKFDRWLDLVFMQRML